MYTLMFMYAHNIQFKTITTIVLSDKGTYMLGLFDGLKTKW